MTERGEQDKRAQAAQGAQGAQASKRSQVKQGVPPAPDAQSEPKASSTRRPYHIPLPYEDLTYPEALSHIKHIKRLGISPMLEVVIEMLEVLGRPNSYYDIIQVGGTNGKTSTSRFTASLLRAHGLRTALYTSPELIDIRERLEIAGELVTPELFATGVAAAKAAGEYVNDRRAGEHRAPYDITEFDTLTVAALVAAALAQVEVCVLEVGMGGRWDATTATSPCITCITGIALDHTHILGDTVEEIAAEKAAIIKRGQHVCVLGPKALTPASVKQAFTDACRIKNVPFIEVLPQSERLRYAEAEQNMLQMGLSFEEYGVFPRSSPTFFDVTDASEKPASVPAQPGAIPARPDAISAEAPKQPVLPAFSAPAPAAALSPHTFFIDTANTKYTIEAALPSYQASNIALALTICEQFFGTSVPQEIAVKGITTCPVPGRFQVIRSAPLHIVDAAHNVESLEIFVNEVKKRWPNKEDRPLLLTAMFEDKDVIGMVRILGDAFPEAVTTQTYSSRALDAKILAKIMRIRGTHIAHTFTSVKDALSFVDDKDFIAAGTITLAGSALAYSFGLPIPGEVLAE